MSFSIQTPIQHPKPKSPDSKCQAVYTQRKVPHTLEDLKWKSPNPAKVVPFYASGGCFSCFKHSTMFQSF